MRFDSSSDSAASHLVRGHAMSAEWVRHRDGGATLLSPLDEVAPKGISLAQSFWTMKHTAERYMTPMPRTIDCTATLVEASELMQELGVRHLPVCRDGKLIGVVSQRTLKSLDAFHDERRRTTTVDRAMSTVVCVAAPDTPLEDVAELMAERRAGSVVIVDHDVVVGIFTALDAVRVLASAMRELSSLRAARPSSRPTS